MKKLSLVFMLFAVLASGVFADISVFGSVGGGATLMKGSNVRTDIIQVGNFLSGSIEASGSDDGDHFGGSVQISAGASSVDQFSWAWGANVWWKPLYFFKLQLGDIDSFALTEIIGWGFHGNDAETYVASPKNNYVGNYLADTTGFYTGTGGNWSGLTLSVSPIYGLDLNIAVPFGRGGEKIDPITWIITEKYKAWDAYLYTNAQAAFTIWGVGRIALSFAGGGNGKLELFEYNLLSQIVDYVPANGFKLYQVKPNAHSIYGSFLLTAFEDLGFSANIGYAYYFPAKNDTHGITYHTPMELGLGASYGTSKWGIKMRVGLSFGGKAVIKSSLYDATVKEPFMLGIGILPYYNFRALSIYLNTGITYKSDEIYLNGAGQTITIGNSKAVGWHINPYVTFTMGAGRFYGGIQIESDGLKYVGVDKQNITSFSGDSYPGQPIVEWSIPIGLLFEF